MTRQAWQNDIPQFLEPCPEKLEMEITLQQGRLEGYQEARKVHTLAL